MKQTFLLQVKNLTVQLSGKPVLNNVSFEIDKGECLAIIGLSGSGKSTLIKTLGGNYFGAGGVLFEKENGKMPNVIIISQQHFFKNLSNTSTFYYQQRFNSCDSEDALMINDVLENLSDDELTIQETLEMLGIGHLRFTRLIQLSNGEHKRFQLAKAILQNADWILLDSPYTGLDAGARKLLNKIIDKLIANGIHILLVTSHADIPASVTHIALLDNGELKEKMPRKEFKHVIPGKNNLPLVNSKSLETIASVYDNDEFSVAIKMVDTNVIYNGRKILDNINWKVNKGECWSVSGHNGSGKSTLLSLITGDNPQAFANEIYLFDKRKGSGESIWDIKQKIGFVSPELHHYFDAACSCFEVVASGLFDTIGLFRQLSEKQRAIVTKWMSLSHLANFEKRLFRQLSNGEQRLVLLARALVKNPPMLILDEPCQGLDDEMSAWFIALINDICVGMKKTLIYVSHYEEEIPPCVTYTLKLEQGKIAA
ncbi:ATP-binding cassette domain-containing protein [Ginsengibacter hankyongi]|uniref:ATP-binding cassette domain-containing protein n=1 Tax=Ginsengibacter hankyongi TaxID=2607284 RepID=A0A5J5IDV3_9BACT|nr:ATP-binding cassette domain-containing protein [Ginsengibacter hankyongi]KAA9038092.1 ATP-binding cassette domain-containing protein [Ginsengibacter hankyongi]